MSPLAPGDDQPEGGARRPLAGRRVLITRRAEQAGELQGLLETAGAQVHLLPLLEIGPPADTAPLDQAIQQLADFHWVVFSSPNTVEFFCARLCQQARAARTLAGLRIAAVGQATADTLRACGIHTDLIPAEHSQDGLIAAFAGISVEGLQILIPASSIGRTRIDAALQERGAIVRRVTVYENHPPDPGRVEIPSALAEGRIDTVVFASPSAVHNFFTLFGEDRARQLLVPVAIAAIGPTTARAIEALGLQVHIQPTEPHIPALVEALCTYYESP